MSNESKPQPLTLATGDNHNLARQMVRPSRATSDSRNEHKVRVTPCCASAPAALSYLGPLPITNAMLSGLPSDSVALQSFSHMTGSLLPLAAIYDPKGPGTTNADGGGNTTDGHKMYVDVEWAKVSADTVPIKVYCWVENWGLSNVEIVYCHLAQYRINNVNKPPDFSYPGWTTTNETGSPKTYSLNIKMPIEGQDVTQIRHDKDVLEVSVFAQDSDGHWYYFGEGAYWDTVK